MKDVPGLVLIILEISTPNDAFPDQVQTDPPSTEALGHVFYTEFEPNMASSFKFE